MAFAATSLGWRSMACAGSDVRTTQRVRVAGSVQPGQDYLRSTFERDHSSPAIRGSPDSTAQTFKLDDLTVVHEQVRLRSEVFDVPREDSRIGRFKHDML